MNTAKKFMNRIACLHDLFVSRFLMKEMILHGLTSSAFTS